MGSVKRWHVRHDDYHLVTNRCHEQCEQMVAASDYDAKERECEAYKQTIDGMVADVRRIQADRDKLAAKVEAIKRLPQVPGRTDPRTRWVNVEEITRALADKETPTGTCELCAPPDTWTAHISGTHGYGKCVERRKGERRASPMYGGGQRSCGCYGMDRKGPDRRGAK